MGWPTGYHPIGPALPGAQSARPARLAGPMLRVTRASAALVIIALGLGLAAAAGIGLLIYLLAGVIHHASGA